MKLTRAEAKKLGLDVPPHKWDKTPGQPKKVGYAGDKLFDDLCRGRGLPCPESEYYFAPWTGGDPACSHGHGIVKCRTCNAERRHWRFDHLFDGWLALEIEGGAFSGGAHVRGKHFLSDMEKYNEAVILGFCVIRCTPQDIESGAAFALVKRALASKEEQA